MSSDLSTALEPQGMGHPVWICQYVLSRDGSTPLCYEIWVYHSGNFRLGHKKVDLFSGTGKEGMLDFQSPGPLPSTGPAHLVGPEGMQAVLQVPSALSIPEASLEEPVPPSPCVW